MAIEKFSFQSGMNASLQVGDKVWAADTTASGKIVQNNLIDVGIVQNITHHNNSFFSIDVSVGSPGAVLPGYFMFFEKNVKANESSLKGYYADVTLENSSKERAELFAVSSEIVPSSK